MLQSNARSFRVVVQIKLREILASDLKEGYSSLNVVKMETNRYSYGSRTAQLVSSTRPQTIQTINKSKKQTPWCSIYG